jgi:hypothetical protein
MKVISIILVLVMASSLAYSQRIGELAPEKPPEIFPDNSWGADLMFGEGGFGLGTFYRRQITQNLIGFVDLSISESKDEREIEYIDFWGNTFTYNKVNRVFLLPLNFGVHYRLFTQSLTENLRPYLNAGIGPTFVVTTPYDIEFFSAFGKAHINYAAGGYIGIGANFGTSKSNLVGINLRYYFVHLFGDGVESLRGNVKKNFGHFYLTLNIGIMY